MSRIVTLAELDQADRRLVEKALHSSIHGYAPYSGFAVGAAVRTKSETYAGANLENASYGVTICAEMAATTAANAAGDQDIEAIAIVGHKFTTPQDSSQVVTPCGRCRQVIFEASQIAKTDVRVLSCSGDLSKIMESTISELLPEAFGPANLGLAEVWPKMRANLRAAVAKLRANAFGGAARPRQKRRRKRLAASG
jgi:cytidine deaminase